MLFHALCALWMWASVAMAQVDFTPSNTTTFEPKSDFRYYNVSANGAVVFPEFQIVPLDVHTGTTRKTFEGQSLRIRLVQVTSEDMGDLRASDFAYLSCDPQDYVNTTTTTTSDIVSYLTNRYPNIIAIVLYTRTARTCAASSSDLPATNYIFTTVDPLAAAVIATTLSSNATAKAPSSLEPDLSSFTNSTYNSNGPTTAVAMIILYSITAIITGLFVVIILTGAIRAHRHPERYGPRNGSGGRGRQSRAKGIARAMLETLPIVKFGDQQNKSDKGASGDIEMVSTTPVHDGEHKAQPHATATPVTASAGAASSSSSSASLKTPGNADGSDEAGSLGCSICTEDFQKGEEVRVLPCNHKFHPECVDPWLLNVSGTCPLCRIDLRTGREAEESASGHAEDASPMSPSSPTATHTLRAALSGSREDRIAALRRFQHERRNRHSVVMGTNNEEERRTMASRLRERFRIRTRQHGTDGATNDDEERGSHNESDTPGQRRVTGTSSHAR